MQSIGNNVAMLTAITEEVTSWRAGSTISTTSA